MNNYRTTILGIVTILASSSVALKAYLTTGTVPDLGLLVSSITAGWGLIVARDAR